MAVEIRIGQLAQQAEISRPTVRYYEQEGLLTPARRTSAGYRVYDAEALARLRFIQRAKALGLSLKEIKLLLSSEDRALERTRLRHLVAHKLAETKERTAELTRLGQNLERLYLQLVRTPDACSCRHLGDCDCLPVPITVEEVMTMKSEVQQIEASTCTCGCEFCGGAGINCGCGCCGPVTEGSQAGPRLVARDCVIPLKTAGPATACACGCCG